MVKKKGARELNPADAHRWVVSMPTAAAAPVAVLVAVCRRQASHAMLLAAPAIAPADALIPAP